MNQIYSPTSNMTTIGYSKKIGKTLTITGIVLVILSMFFMNKILLLGYVFFALGIFLCIRGCAYQINRAYFTLDDCELCIYNIRERKYKIYQYNSPKDITVEGDKIYLQTNERKKKLPIEKWVIDKKDWEIFITKISQ